MTTGTGEDEFDFSTVVSEPAAMPTSPKTTTTGIPNHKASSTARRRILGKDKPKPQSPRKTEAAPRTPNRKGQFVEPLTTLYGYVALGLMPVDPTCANAILQAAGQCAEALDQWAYRNEAIRKVLWSITQSSDLAMVVTAHFPILLAISVHHVPAVRDAMNSQGKQFADLIAASPPDTPVTSNGKGKES